MKCFFYSLIALIAMSRAACGVELVGHTHADFVVEWQTSQFCCNGQATYKIQWDYPSVYVNHLSILDHANKPVWSVGDFAVDFDGLSQGLRFELLDDYLRISNIPELEVELSPDIGFGVHEFYPISIQVPHMPEPSSFGLLMGFASLLGLIRPKAVA